MTEKWYRKTAVQASLVGAIVAGLFGIANLVVPKFLDQTDPSAIVMPKVTLPLPGKQTFNNGQFSLALRSADATDMLEISVRAPDGTLKQWRQGIGAEDYKFGSQVYIVHILSIGANEVEVTVAKRL